MTSVQRLEMTEKSCPSDQILSAVLNRDIDIIRRTIEETSHEMFWRSGRRNCLCQKDLYY